MKDIDKMMKERNKREKKVVDGHPEAKRVLEELEEENFSEYKNWQIITEPRTGDLTGQPTTNIRASKGEINLALGYRNNRPHMRVYMLKHLLFDIDERE